MSITAGVVRRAVALRLVSTASTPASSSRAVSPTCRRLSVALMGKKLASLDWSTTKP